MAEDTPSNNTPDVTNSWYDSMLPTWTFLQDLLDGQDTVKLKTTTYLPQEPAETDEDYQSRLARSVFFEDYRDCVVNLGGMVFRKSPTLGEDVPEALKALTENIDNAGTHLDVFLQRVFEDAFFGHSFIVIDMPSLSDDVQTAADEMAIGARAYWCLRRAVDALNWRITVKNGQTFLTQITFQECTKEPDGLFGETEVTRWRVYRLNELGEAEWQLWEETTKNNSAGAAEKIIEMTATDVIRTKKGVPMNRLPIAVHYGEHEGFLKSRPPLKGIADISAAIYQKYSDLSNIEHHTCAVTLALIGVDDQSGNKTIGGNCIIYLPTGADAKFLTIDGDSIPALERDLEMLYKRLVAKGLDFVNDDHYVPPTATEALLSYTERTSKMSKMVRSLKDCTELALEITAEMEGLDFKRADGGGSVTLGVDENSLTLSPEQMRILSEMNERGQLSLQTLWSVLDRADQLPDDFDPEKELQLVIEAAERQIELNAKQFDAGAESTP